MLVFVLQTGDREAYPPCGLRVATSKNVRELKRSLEEYFEFCEGVADEAIEPLIAATSDDEIAAALPALLRNRDWCIYDSDIEYARFITQ